MALYKRHMNINEMARLPWSWHQTKPSSVYQCETHALLQYTNLFICALPPAHQHGSRVHESREASSYQDLEVPPSREFLKTVAVSSAL